MEKFTVTPIGYIKRELHKVFLKINVQYISALNGLENFSHAQILWWITGFEDDLYREITETDPPYNAPRLGIFATRSPIRPNPIGLSTVKILDIDLKNGIIEIPKIDAFTDTPILDIKAYYPSCDRVKTVTVPSWAKDWGLWLDDDGLDIE